MKQRHYPEVRCQACGGKIVIGHLSESKTPYHANCWGSLVTDGLDEVVLQGHKGYRDTPEHASALVEKWLERIAYIWRSENWNDGD